MGNAAFFKRFKRLIHLFSVMKKGFIMFHNRVTRFFHIRKKLWRLKKRQTAF
jgi:hypothetical protein